MKAVLKALAVALPLAAGALIIGSAVSAPGQNTPPAPSAMLIAGAAAQERGLPPADPQARAERKRMLTEVLSRAIPASRAPEIYTDLRYALGELYLPHLREILSNREASKLDQQSLERLSVLVPLLDYGLKAARELDPAVAGLREALIADMAALQAKYSSEEAIRFVGELLDTAAARKGFDTLYALSRLMTGYTQEDMRSSKDMSAWLKDFKFDFKDNPLAPRDMPPPSMAKVAKAQAAVMDFMRVARIDDMVADIVSFGKNVVLEVQSLKPEEREAVRAGLEQLQFYYNLGKSMAIAVAPSGLAAAFTDAQLDKLDAMLLSPVMAKSFNYLYGAVREATSFTRHDVEAFRRVLENGEKAKDRWELTPENVAKLNAEWEALGNHWRGRLLNGLTPDTRLGLEAALAAFETMVAEEEARRNADRGGGDDKGDTDPLAPGGQQRKL